MKEGKTLDNTHDKKEYTKADVTQAILEKCDFFYDDALLSKETIIREYLKFLAQQFNPNEKTIGFAFHTGSKCFDMVSLPALLIGSLFYGLPSNEDRLRNLERNDMVLYENKRYRFKGFEKIGDVERIGLEEDIKNANPCTTWKIYEQIKHLITPYYRNSEKTGGQGVKKISEYRADFISYILSISAKDVPSTLDYSVLIVANKDDITDLCKRINIKYDDKTVKITDIVTVAYFTSNETEHQIGSNSANIEAVIKVANDVSTALKLALDKDLNKVRGVLITNAMKKSGYYSQLTKLLGRESLNFAIITETLDFDLCNWAMRNYDSANFYACTKAYLENIDNNICCQNEYTEDLYNKTLKIICHKIRLSPLSDSLSYYDDEEITNILWQIKENDSFENNVIFCKSAWRLRKLLTGSFIRISTLEKLITNEDICIKSPKADLEEMADIAEKLGNPADEPQSMQKQADKVGFTFVKMYYLLLDNSPKETELTNLFLEHLSHKVAFIVRDKRQVELFEKVFAHEFANVECMYLSKFNPYKEYDVIIFSGDIRKFNLFQCFSASDIFLLCYDFEKESFLSKQRKIEQIETKLNNKIRCQINERGVV